MKKWLLPIRLMVLFLAVLALLAAALWNRTDLAGWTTSLLNFALLFGSGWIASQGLVRSGFAKASLWEHRLITCLILFLLFDALSPWWVFLALGIVTELLERLVRVSGSPVFNPAGFGAFVASIFGFLPTWWGTNFAPRLPLFEGGMSIAAFLTLGAAGYIAYRYKKVPLALTALAAFCLVYGAVFQSNPLPIALEGTLLFFFLVMAVEPKTSPAARNEQYAYGVILGGLIPLFLFLGFPDSYLAALLVANLYHKRQAFATS